MFKKKEIKKNLPKINILNKLKSILESKLNSRIIACLILAIFHFSFYSFFLKNWQIVFWDIDIGFYTWNYLNEIKTLYNETWSTTNFFNYTRSFFVIPLYYFSLIFGWNSILFEKLIIFSLLFLSSSWMFILAYEILKRETFRKKFNLNIFQIFVLALFAWIFYGCNPWEIMRIQHIYILVWYAFLPFIFYEILYFSEFDFEKKEEIRNVKIFSYHIFLASIFYIISLWAVHYLFFTFFVIVSWFFYRFIYFLYTKQFLRIKISFLKYLIFWIFFSILLSFWIIPYIWAVHFGNISPQNINTLDTIVRFSRNSDFTNVIYLISYWWPMVDFSNFDSSFWISGAFLFFIIIALNIFSYKSKYVVFFLLFSIPLFFLSLWTNWPLKDFYVYLVFDSPFSDSFGFIFREANKFVWLLAFCFSILIATWLATILSFLRDILYSFKKEEKLIKQKWFDKELVSLLKNYSFTKKFVFVSSTLLIFIFITSYFFYIKPFHQVFVKNFYSPIEIPKDYVYFINKEKNEISEEKRILYFPRYERIVSKNYNFWVATWNRNFLYERPTWSMDLQSSVNKTYHPLEGSTTYLWNFYDYIDYYLTNNVWKNLSKYLYLVWVNNLVYHSDILWLEDNQKHQLKNIETQLKKETEIWFISSFFTWEKVSDFTTFSNKVFHFWGISNLETLLSFKDFNYKKFSNIFVWKDPNINNFNKLEGAWDIINIYKKEDLFLNNLDDEKIITFFDKNNFSDPFLNWAKSRLDIPDFKWYLKNLWINNFNWDFDLNKWIIFTYSSSKLDVKPYEDLSLKWTDIIDFSQIVDSKDFFTPNDEANIKISVDKKERWDNTKSVKWEILKWDSKIWKIGNMNTILVKPETGYFFQILLSWKWVDQIHGKVKFFDERWNELWNSYVSSPSYVENFDRVKFTWSFVTPKETSYILFQLWSLQRMSETTYWWIHDLKIKDLSEFTKPNIFSQKYTFKTVWKHEVYARIFDNTRWWKISFKIWEKEFIVNTKSQNKNKFYWIKLWNIYIDSLWEKEIILRNLSWFNAVNLLAIVPEYYTEDFNKNFEKNNTLKANQIIWLEAEKDFSIFWNIQWNEKNINLSNWKSINLNNWNIENSFDILKSWAYNIKLKLNSLSKASAYFEIKISTGDKEIYKKWFYNIEKEVTLENIKLDKWSYKLNIKIQNLEKQLVSKYNFVREKAIEENANLPQDEKWCTYFEGLYNSNLSSQNTNDWKKFFLKPWKSCYRLVISHNPVKVTQNKEYILKVNLKKQDTKMLHAKVKFFDKNKNFLSDFYFEDYDSNFKDNEEIITEKIIKTPENTDFMQITFNQRQEQKPSILSIYTLYNVELLEYQNLPWVDSVLIYDKNSDIFTNSSKFIEKSQTWVIQLNKTFSPLWQLDWQKPFISNFFLNWYISSDSKKEVNFVLETLWKIWYFITLSFLIFWFSFWLIYLIIRNKRKKVR